MFQLIENNQNQFDFIGNAILSLPIVLIIIIGLIISVSAKEDTKISLIGTTMLICGAGLYLIAFSDFIIFLTIFPFSNENINTDTFNLILKVAGIVAVITSSIYYFFNKKKYNKHFNSSIK